MPAMPLVVLDCRRTRVTDLRPISRLPLNCLNLGGTPVTDFGSVRNLKLTRFMAGETAFQDLWLVADLPLEVLDISGSRVRSLAPVRGRPVHDLSLEGCEVADLSPLRDTASLEQLRGPVRATRDATVLRSMKALKRVNGLTVAQFLERKETLPEPRPWKALFDGKTVDCLSLEGEGAWVVEGGALARNPDIQAAAQIQEEFEDGEFRVRFQQEGAESFVFTPDADSGQRAVCRRAG